MNKWCMHKPEYVLENKMHKFHWDFELQIDHLISARRPDLVITNKKVEFLNCGLRCFDWPQSKIERKWKEKSVPRPYLGTEKTVEQENDSYTNWHLCFWYSHQRTRTRTGGLGNKWTSEDHPNHCIIKNVQNTEKSSRDLKRLTVTQTPVENYQL